MGVRLFEFINANRVMRFLNIDIKASRVWIQRHQVLKPQEIEKGTCMKRAHVQHVPSERGTYPNLTGDNDIQGVSVIIAAGEH